MAFNEKKSSGKRRGASGHDGGVTILTAGCHFEGKLYCRGASRIAGKIEGEIVSEGILVIEEGAEIDAHIKADEAIVQGHVTGTLEAKERIELTASAVLDGNVVSPVLVVHEGAKFNGSSKMNIESSKDKVTPISVSKSDSKNIDVTGAAPDIDIRP